MKKQLSEWLGEADILSLKSREFCLVLSYPYKHENFEAAVLTCNWGGVTERFSVTCAIHHGGDEPGAKTFQLFPGQCGHWSRSGRYLCVNRCRYWRFLFLKLRVKLDCGVTFTHNHLFPKPLGSIGTGVPTP